MEGRVLLSTDTLSTLGTFGRNASGASPQYGLVADANGNLYGTAGAGGVYGDGTVFEVANASGAMTTLASFNGENGVTPQGLSLDAASNLFGTTLLGGANGDGTAFEIGRGSNVITTLVSFSGTSPAGITVDSSDDLFGTTSARDLAGVETVFEIAGGSNAVTTLAAFNGANGSDPQGALTLDASGNLDGTTYDGGANNDGSIFEVANGSGTITTLYSFSGDRAGPNGLTFDASGDIYGTASAGGVNFVGTVFELAKGSNTITNLTTFSSTDSYGEQPNCSLALDPSGDLYGTNEVGGPGAYGTVFEIARGSTAVTLLASFSGPNGNDPSGRVTLDSSGDLYGTTYDGGTARTGTVFKVTKGTGTVTSIVSFDGTNGLEPKGMMASDALGNLYGETLDGGAYGYGTVFEIHEGSSTFTTLASFNYADGWAPQGGLTVDAAGDLFGTTLNGGANDEGTVFEIAAGSHTITTVTSFNATDGESPYGGVALDASGDIYGTTNSGGSSDYGTIFEIARGSAVVTTIVSFNGIDAAYPKTGVVVDTSEDIYGMSSQGGPTGNGTLFEIPHGSDVVTTLAGFNPPAGQSPLTFDAAGNLYGTTLEGGAARDGTVFEVPKGSVVVTTIATFDKTSGEYPSGLSFDSSGNMYGTTGDGGIYNGGTVFEIVASSTAITTLASLPALSSPGSGVALDRWGNLYGTTSVGAYLGGTSGLGTVFELTAPPTVILSLGSAPNPSNASQPLTFVATVGGGVPDGETVSLEDASDNNAVVAIGTLNNGAATLSVAPGRLLAGTHGLVAVYGGDAHFATSQSAPYVQTVQVALTSVVINGTNSALVGVQRSMVDSIVYTFSEAVNVGANAFSIAVHSGQNGTAPSLAWAAINPNGDGSSTQWVVTFSGAGVTGGSIGNGVYDISLNSSAATSDANPAVTVQTRPVDTFYRLYGDINGDGRVNNADYAAFLSTNGLKAGQTGFNAGFDSDGDGRVNNNDYAAFLTTNGMKLSGFTTTI
jgi:uncharacterized repeat protein (TIGR03803 family)